MTSLLSILNIFQFFSSVFIVDVEQVNVYWAVEILYEILKTFDYFKIYF